MHQTIQKVGEDIEGMRFNTAISKMMELVNEMSREEKILSMIGTPPTFISDFGTVSVIGRNLVPFPAASITAFIFL